MRIALRKNGCIIKAALGDCVTKLPILGIQTGGMRAVFKGGISGAYSAGSSRRTNSAEVNLALP